MTREMCEISRKRSHSSAPHSSLHAHLSVPVDHHLLGEAHFNWITPQTSSLLCRHDGRLGILQHKHTHQIHYGHMSKPVQRHD